MGTKLMFQKATVKNKLEISVLRQRVYKSMIASGLNQWNEEYPSDSILFEDIDNGNMYLAIIDGAIAAYVIVDEYIPEEYESIRFQFESPKVCIHRLSVNPDYLRMGIASELMHYIQEEIRQMGYKSIVLDTHYENNAALSLYKKLGYTKRGHVIFPRKPHIKFVTMEKALY